MNEKEALTMNEITINATVEKKPWNKPMIHDLQVKDTFGSKKPSPILEGDLYQVAS